MNGTRTLLTRDDPPPFVAINSGARSPFVLIGDHAGRAVPSVLDGLGVSAADMDRHIAWDIGIAGLGEKLAGLLDAPFIRQTYSRLVIDCNRDPARDDAMPKISDGTTIPGNQTLTDADREARRREIFQPYQDRIAAELDGRGDAPTVVVALHSFTPVMKGFVRPWRYGVLHLHDSPLSLRLLEDLRARFGEAVGDNEPYAMDGIDYTIPFHAIGRGLDYLELETRQNLLADEDGQAAVAEMLATVLRQLAKFI